MSTEEIHDQLVSQARLDRLNEQFLSHEEAVSAFTLDIKMKKEGF
jgi:hypothetical protein